MNSSEIKRLLTRALDKDSDAETIARRLEEEGVVYDFSAGFSGKVLDRIFHADVKEIQQIEFSRYLYLAFSRIALTGVAAIVLLLISIFLMEGDLTLSSILGIGDSQTESIVYLLTGN